ncbi:10596_t:CDS:1, partial [Ambispora gerdemannii]
EDRSQNLVSDTPISPEQNHVSEKEKRQEISVISKSQKNNNSESHDEISLNQNPSDSIDDILHDGNFETELNKNQFIEQELKQQISSTKQFHWHNTSSINIAWESNTQSVILSGDGEPVTAESVVYVFYKAIQSGQEGILYWYHFAVKYDRRIDEVSVSNKVGKKKATSLVYREIKQLLPDITD